MKDMPELYDHVEEEIEAEMKYLNALYPINPGAMVRRELEEMEDVVFYRLPSDLRSLLLEIVAGKARTDDHAGVLSKYIGGTKELWEKLQEQYDENNRVTNEK